MEESRAYSTGNCFTRQCLCCGAILKAIERHGVKNAELPRQFKRKTPDGQAEYLVEQKRRRKEALQKSGCPASAMPYDFSDLVGVQKQTSGSLDILDIETDWQPLRKWFMFEKILNPALGSEVALPIFISKRTDGAHRAQKVNNEWCLAVFDGAKSKERSFTGFESEVQRHLYDHN